jgi:hypothetical protein
MKTSDTITKISASINKSQSKFMHVVKDVKGARGLYASLPAVIESVRPILNENGISVLQHSHPSETGVCLSTVLLHTSGEWIADGGLFIPCVKNDPQAFGSAMSYARRYSLLAMLGVAADDDDGKAALDPPKPLNDEQVSVLLALSLAMRPDQNEDTAKAKISKFAADEYADRAFMAVDVLVKKGTIYDKHGIELKDAILNGDSGIVAMIQDAIEGANNEA